MRLILLMLLTCGTVRAQALVPTFYTGNDLSYVNQMEDCGAVYKEDGVPTDVYQLFADHGTNLVRVRLWVDPTWQQQLVQPPGVKPQYSDLEDVRETLARAKSAGMQVLLDLHYSDFWADPAKQIIPARWRSAAYEVDALADSVYHYTRRVLLNLDRDGLLPDLVQIGNEVNGGLLVHETMTATFEAKTVVSTSWARHARLFNAGIRAVREVAAQTAVAPRIVLHFAEPVALVGAVQRLIDHGVTDFDIVGFSYYYAWHGGSLTEMGEVVREVRHRFPAYDVLAVETGYLWTTSDFDALPNLISTPDPAYLPVSPEKQLEYLVDYAYTVRRAGGAGVVVWEPAWVSTPCRTPWGQGSSHDHVAFFDPRTTTFLTQGGGRWTDPDFYPSPDARKVVFRLNMTGQDVSGGVYVAGTFTGEQQTRRPMLHEGRGIYSAFMYLPPGSTGTYYFLDGPAWSDRETVPAACALGTDRTYAVGDTDMVQTNAWGSCEPFPATSAAESASPTHVILHPNVPNPFAETTTLAYDLLRTTFVRLEVFNMLGQRVRLLAEGVQGAGRHTVQLDGVHLPAGIYVYRLTTPEQIAQHRLMHVR